MKKNSIYIKESLYIYSALVAVHANSDGKGMRQKDLKFYIELLSNWMETSFDSYGLEIQNTQIQRVLNTLSNEGLLKKKILGKIPQYTFTSLGLLEIVNRLINLDLSKDLEGFFFLYHCIYLYSDHIKDLLKSQKDFLPPSYELELRHLLNAENILLRQIQRIEKNIKKLNLRIDEAVGMAEVSKKLFEDNYKLDEVLEIIERKYPYQLNNQKKMGELFKSLPLTTQRRELTSSPLLRVEFLWKPLLKHYENYLNILEDIK